MTEKKWICLTCFKAIKSADSYCSDKCESEALNERKRPLTSNGLLMSSGMPDIEGKIIKQDDIVKLSNSWGFFIVKFGIYEVPERYIHQKHLGFYFSPMGGGSCQSFFTGCSVCVVGNKKNNYAFYQQEQEILEKAYGVNEVDMSKIGYR